MHKTVAQAEAASGRGKGPSNWVVRGHQTSLSLACFRFLADVCVPLRRKQTRAPAGKQSHILASAENVNQSPNPENTRKFNNRLTVSRL